MRVKKIMLVTIGLLLFLCSTELTLAAPVGWEVPAGYTAITDAPNINIVNYSGSNVEIPGEYATMFKVTKDTYYESSGTAQIVDYQAAHTQDSSNPSRLYKFDPGNTTDEQYVIVRNAGLYNGEVVDLKVKLNSYNIQPRSQTQTYPYVSINALSYADSNRTTVSPVWRANLPYRDSFLAIGSGLSTYFTDDKFQNGDSFDYSYEILKKGTNEPVENFKGVWNFLNLNKIKAMTTVPKTVGDFEDFYIYDPVSVKAAMPTLGQKLMGYKFPLGSNMVEFTGTDSQVGKPTARITQLSDQTKINLRMESRFIPTVSNPANPMAITYSTQSIARIAPAKPIIKAEINNAKHNEKDYKKIKYSILQVVPDNDVNNRDDILKINTEVPEAYQIDSSDIKIYEYGTDQSDSANDLTSYFEISLDPTDSSKAIISAKSDKIKTDEFTGKVYEIQVKASWKSATTFETVKDDYNKTTKYLEYELEKKTSTFYSYQYSVSGGGILSNTLIAEKTDSTLAKALYQGIPYGEGKGDLVANPNTLIKDTYPDPKDLLAKIWLDTDQDASGVTVTYDDDTVTTGAENTDTTVKLILTTADGITNSVDVSVKAVQPYAAYTVKFVDEGGDTLNPDVNVVKNKGQEIDLTQETDISTVVDKLKTEGYKQQTWDNDFPENAYEFNDTTGTITYKFKGDLAFSKVPKNMDFETGVVNPAIDQTLNYNGADDFVISVKDLRSKNGATDYQRGQFKIQGKMTTPFTAADSSVLSNAQLIYNATGSDGDDISISNASSAVIYTNAKSDDKQFDVKLDDANKTTATKKGLRLQLDKGNNAEAKNYTAKITWDLVTGP